MSFAKIAVAALGGTVAYFLIGFLLFGLMPFLRNEFSKYPGIYRTQDDMRQVMPLGMVGIFVSILVLAVLYAMIYRGGSGAVEGIKFGALIGLFAVGAFVLHNFVNLNIGAKLTAQQAAAYFLEWSLVGLVIGLIYQPA